MNIVADPGAIAEGEPRQSRSENSLWHHAALCQMALPVRTPKTASWQREIPTAAITIASSAAEADAQDGGRLPLPGGQYLRRILLHLFTTAIETNSALVELGESASALAGTMQLDIADKELANFADQCA